MSKNTGTVIISLLTGIALGTAAGILFAPDRGSKTRGKLKNGLSESKKSLDGKFEELTSKLKSSFAKEKKDFATIIEDIIAKADGKKEDVIATLEDKLRELKKTAASAKN